MIRPATPGDIENMAAMGVKLWPEETVESLRTDFSEISGSSKDCVFLSEENNQPVGFIHVSVRHDYVEGSSSSPTGYVEAVYVAPDHRQTGVGKALLAEAEKWCLQKGCIEIGSDTEIENTISQIFHLGAGFTRSNVLVTFIKKLT